VHAGQGFRTNSPPVSAVVTCQTGPAARYTSPAGECIAPDHTEQLAKPSSEPATVQSIDRVVAGHRADLVLSSETSRTEAAEAGRRHADLHADAHADAHLDAQSASQSDISSADDDDDDDDDDVIVISSSSLDAGDDD